MNTQAVIPKVLQLPLWIVYQKEQSQWIPKAAFVGKAECDVWASHNLGAVPSRDMHATFCTVYASRVPGCHVQVEGNRFLVSVVSAVLDVLDLNACPEALPMVEHTLGMLDEFRSFQERAKTNKDQWNKFRALMRHLTEDDLLLAPRTHT